MQSMSRRKQAFSLDEPNFGHEGDEENLADTMKVYTCLRAHLPGTKKAGTIPAL